MSSLTSPRILVTGATGFAGSHLIDHLLQSGYETIHATSYGSSTDEKTDVSYHKVDLTDNGAVQDLLQTSKPDWIFHLAALSAVGESFQNPAKVLTTNQQIQLVMLESIFKHSPRSRMLSIGSAHQYDLKSASLEKIPETHPFGPSNPYAVSKVTQEMLAISYHYAHNLDIVRVRPFNHIGERQTTSFAIASFAKQIVAVERGEAKAIKVGNLDAIRDMTDVKDIVKGYELLMKEAPSGEVYNIGSGRGYTMQDILDMLVSLASVSIEVTTDTSKVRPVDVPKMVANIDKISTLGWKPTIEIKLTLKRVLEYWRKQS